MQTAVRLAVIAAAFVVTAAVPASNGDPIASKWYVSGTPGFNYSCAGKADGNYPHPTKCTHYVACVAETEAYEMVCALNTDGQPLHYVQDSGPDPATSRCDYPAVAGCEAQSTEAPPAPEPQPCDPDDCQLEGYCRTYNKCVEGEDGTSHLETLECGQDLFWNSQANNIHGGVCDYFVNLPEDVKATYLNDENCIPPCAWWQNEECSPTYQYREQFNNRTLLNREHELNCPQAPAGEEPLYWDGNSHTCARCSTVAGKDGQPCSCNNSSSR